MTSYNKNDPATIQAMFGSIAKHYDRAMPFSPLAMHKRWNPGVSSSIHSSTARPHLGFMLRHRRHCFRLSQKLQKKQESHFARFLRRNASLCQIKSRETKLASP